MEDEDDISSSSMRLSLSDLYFIQSAAAHQNFAFFSQSAFVSHFIADRPIWPWPYDEIVADTCILHSWKYQTDEERHAWIETGEYGKLIVNI
jgi:hypothetical protein